MRMKKWQNVVILDNPKDAAIMSTKEGYGKVNYDFDNYPLQAAIPKKRTFLGAVKKMIEYSRIGLFNLMVKGD